jgi:hypothetical protein
MRHLVCSLVVALALPATSCSNGGNSLTGSISTVYDLSFNSITIELEGTNVLIEYVGDNGYPAIVAVNIQDIVNVANSSISLVQEENGQPRGSIRNVSGETNQLMIEIGTITFDETPKVGSQLSGNFAATFTSGLTLDGTFSGKVYAP